MDLSGSIGIDLDHDISKTLKQIQGDDFLLERHAELTSPSSHSLEKNTDSC